MKRPFNKTNPRFVWIIGAIAETYTDLQGVEYDGTVLYDRQERAPVLTLHQRYANAFCLETTHSAASQPLSTVETWFNGLTNDELVSEGIPPSGVPRNRFKPYNIPEWLAKMCLPHDCLAGFATGGGVDWVVRVFQNGAIALLSDDTQDMPAEPTERAGVTIYRDQDLNDGVFFAFDNYATAIKFMLSIPEGGKWVKS